MNFSNKVEEIYKPYQSKRKSLKCLLVSDIHQNFDFLSQVKQWITSSNQTFDLVICSGDTCNWNVGDSVQKEREEVDNGVQILKELASITGKVLFIPGNHDPPFFYEPTQDDSLINLHRTSYKIDEGLYITGFGGATPGFKTGEKLLTDYPFYSSNFEVAWPGYPYNANFEESEAAYEEDFTSYWTEIKTKAEENASFLLVTHQGPFFSSTTLMVKDNKYIYSGTKFLWKFLFSGKENIVLNVHGHSHDALGRISLGVNYIVNPGSVNEGRLATIKIVETYTGKWQVGETEFVDLNFY